MSKPWARDKIAKTESREPQIWTRRKLGSECPTSKKVWAVDVWGSKVVNPNQQRWCDEEEF
jgi:hypothetical protein